MLLALTSTLVAAQPEPRPNPFLAQAKVLYLDLEYARCAQRLEQGRSWKSSRQELAEAELYAGLCAFGLGDTEEAARHFQMSLGIQPDIQLPMHTSPKIREQFNAVSENIRRDTEAAEPEKPALVPAPLAEPVTAPDAPKAEAARPTPVLPVPAKQRPPSPSARAAQPKGRSLILPLTLAGGAAVSFGAGGYFGLRAQRFEKRSYELKVSREIESAGLSARQNAKYSNVAYGVGAASAVAALFVYFAFPAETGNGATP
jgi:hypothetical protein